MHIEKHMGHRCLSQWWYHYITNIWPVPTCLSAAKFYCQQPYLARRNIKGGQWFTIRGPGNKFFIPFLDYYILQKIKLKCSSKQSLGFIFNHGLGLWLHSHWAFITFNGAQTINCGRFSQNFCEIHRRFGQSLIEIF